MDYFEEALKRDPYDIRTNIAVGNIHLRNGEYESCQKLFHQGNYKTDKGLHKTIHM